MFGDYPKRRCGNPECGSTFKPVTPWQSHCTKGCKDHTAYLRTVVPKRVSAAEARLSGLRKKGVDSKRLNRMEARIGLLKRKALA